jgi:hypothetical protein
MKLALTDKFVFSAKPGTYFDDKVPGLHLRVTGGAKGWSLLFTVPGGGKRARMALGRYPATSLSELARLPSRRRPRSRKAATRGTIVTSPRARRRSRT